MEPKPKERIVFDEDLYYGDEGEEMAINDLMERDGLTEGEVREDFTDDEIFNHQMEMKDFDYEEEMRALAAFFNGEKSDMSDFVNPYGGNHILVSGSVGRWNGTSTGIAVYKDFDAATDCSPSRFGQGNVFADCEIQKVWDENGTLYLAGAHHDGRVSVEMRQLTDEGERLWGQLDYEDYLPLEGLTAIDDRYKNTSTSTAIADGEGATGSGIPTREEVRSHFAEMGFAVDPDRFFDVNEGRGWRTNSGKPVDDWKKLAAVWDRNERPKAATPPARTEPKANAVGKIPSVEEVMAKWGCDRETAQGYIDENMY